MHVLSLHHTNYNYKYNIYIYTTSSPSPKLTGTLPLPLVGFADNGLTWDQWTLFPSFALVSEFLWGGATSVSTVDVDVIVVGFVSIKGDALVGLIIGVFFLYIHYMCIFI